MGFLNRILSALSGGTGTRNSDQLLMDKVIGFKGIVPGVGTSTIVQNVAAALSESTSQAICVVDTNFIFPSQASLLGVKADDIPHDLLDFSGDVALVTSPTSLRGVRLASLHNRSLAEALSPRDTQELVTELIEKLKGFFDIILVDLSHEWTNINTYAAIKCNKIYLVADPSVKTMYNIQKSLNLMATLALPAGKTERVILNKILPDIVSSADKVLQDAGLKIVGGIPLSRHIANFGVSGKSAWGGRSTVSDLNIFSGVINTIVSEINVMTPVRQQVEASSAPLLASTEISFEDQVAEEDFDYYNDNITEQEGVENPTDGQDAQPYSIAKGGD